jgi:methylenetetrahydrofolate reductase (NADPH)
VKLTVTASPTRGLEGTLALSEDLAGRGYRVACHLSARLVRDQEHLRDILARLDVAGLRDALVIAGDVRRPAGPYSGAADLLRTMANVGHNLEHVGISGYPESHPFLSDEATIEAMFEKEPYATYIVSQVCFDARTIARWIGAVRERGTTLPIDVGIPGVVGWTRLLRIAKRIGVGESARFLRNRRSWIGRLVAPAGYHPDELVEELAPTVADQAAAVAGFHVFTFNELEATERWRRETLGRLRTA